MAASTVRSRRARPRRARVVLVSGSPAPRVTDAGVRAEPRRAASGLATGVLTAVPGTPGDRSARRAAFRLRPLVVAPRRKEFVY
jgi:hypothetical protein